MSSRISDGIAAKDVVLEYTWKRPRQAAVVGVSIAALPKVGRDTIELPPADHHPVVIVRVDRDRGLVSGVTGDIHPVRINVDLVTRETVKYRYHSGRKPRDRKVGSAAGRIFRVASVATGLCGSILGRSEEAAMAK